MNTSSDISRNDSMDSIRNSFSELSEIYRQNYTKIPLVPLSVISAGILADIFKTLLHKFRNRFLRKPCQKKIKQLSLKLLSQFLKKLPMMFFSYELSRFLKEFLHILSQNSLQEIYEIYSRNLQSYDKEFFLRTPSDNHPGIYLKLPAVIVLRILPGLFV